MREHPESPPPSLRNGSGGLGNPQSNSFSMEWLAGLIVGEGCFTIGAYRLKQSKSGWIRLTPVFSLTMSDWGTMERVADSMRHHGFKIYVSTQQAPSQAGKRPMMRIQSTGIGSVGKIARAFAPLLSGHKQQAAEIVARFSERRLARHKRGIDEDDIIDVEAIRKVNHRNGGTKYSIEDLRDYKVGPQLRGGRYSPNSDRKTERAAEMTAPGASAE